jgi:hypothetical protein
MKRLSLVPVLLVATAGALSCGLISSDIGTFSFPLPRKTYVFNSAAWGVPAGNTMAIPCGGGPLTVQDCCNPPAPFPKPDCGAHPLVCEANVCTLKQPVTIVQPVDFKKEVPSLASVSDQHLANLSLSSLQYEVTVNSLNVAVPMLSLYLAPANVTMLPNADAQLFATVPAIPKGMPVPVTEAERTDGADAAFATFGSTLGTPFNILVGTTVTVPSGSPTPMGQINVVITGTLKAKLAL